VVVHRVNRSELKALVDLHKKAFPGFLMTLLGDRFLYEYYNIVFDYSGNIMLLCDESENVHIGFVVGFRSPNKFYSSLKKKKFNLLACALGHLISTPRLFYRVFKSYKTAAVRAADKGYGDDVAELASIGVDPNSRNRGAGRLLLSQFIEEGKKMGVKKVYLTTDRNNNDHVNRFYTQNGFVICGINEIAKDRPMNRYVLVIK